MSYGSPSLASAVDDLLAQGAEHIVVRAAVSAIFLLDGGRRLGRTGADSGEKRAIPGISFIRDYAEHPDYIHALAASVRALSFAVHGNRICCCSPIMGSRSAMPTRAMIILSAVAIRRGNWFPRWGCRRAGDDDFPVALWPGTLADAVHR